MPSKHVYYHRKYIEQMGDRRRKYDSVLSKVRSEGRSDETFERKLMNLSFEEMFAIRLELASSWGGDRVLYGIPLYKILPEMVRIVALKWAKSVAETDLAAARLLGLTKLEFRTNFSKYGLYKYFQESGPAAGGVTSPFMESKDAT